MKNSVAHNYWNIANQRLFVGNHDKNRSVSYNFPMESFEILVSSANIKRFWFCLSCRPFSECRNQVKSISMSSGFRSELFKKLTNEHNIQIFLLFLNCRPFCICSFLSSLWKFYSYVEMINIDPIFRLILSKIFSWELALFVLRQPKFDFVL